MREDRQSTDAIAAEASAWIARLETGGLSVSDMAAFREWIRQSPSHATEVNRLAALSTDLEQLAEFALDRYAADIDVSPVQTARKRRARMPLAVGMGVAALLVAVLMLVVPDLLEPAAERTNGLLTTPVGGYLEMELADGSLLKLNTDTSLTVAFDDGRRTVQLHRGEVFVRVAHHPDWPFAVHTDTRQVLAVGTAFVVRLLDERIRVMVTEGTVAISQQIGEVADPSRNPGAPSTTAPGIPLPAAPILLQAGQAFEDSPSGAHPVTRIAAVEARRRLAWQRGLVEFTDTPLHEVVEEVSRYTDLTIRFEDAELRDVRFGGIFPTGEIHLLFGVLESTYGVSVAYVDETTVSLTPRQ